ncbi:unnamed protein product [Toxocara canis]|uniref:Prothymosin alpha-like n=1 Tax=Toxocara canis TaxID=6265 RepID=A0A183U7Q0_TOXCA|nr:unnamed protein product [Toxocara canis]
MNNCICSVSLVNEIDEELPRTARRRNKKIVLSDSEDERDDSDDEEKMKKSNVDVEREKSTEEGDDGNVAKDEIEKADKVSDNLSGDEKETMSNDDPAHEENFIEVTYLESNTRVLTSGNCFLKHRLKQ